MEAAVRDAAACAFAAAPKGKQLSSALSAAMKKLYSECAAAAPTDEERIAIENWAGLRRPEGWEVGLSAADLKIAQQFGGIPQAGTQSEPRATFLIRQM